MAYNPYNPFSWNAQNNPAYNFGQGLYNFTHAPFNETFQKGVDTHIGNVNQTNTRANQLLKEIQGNQTQNTGGTIDLSGKVNKMSAFPDISNINWSGDGNGIFFQYDNKEILNSLDKYYI